MLGNMLELEDRLVLGTNVERREGSTPSIPRKKKYCSNIGEKGPHEIQ